MVRCLMKDIRTLQTLTTETRANFEKVIKLEEQSCLEH